MSLFNSHTLTVTRTTGGGVDDARGYWDGDTPSTFDIHCSVQPAPDKVRENVPEGYDASSTLLLVTDTELHVSGRGEQRSDKVSYLGDDYDVIAIERWQNSIISHYEYLIALPEE